MVRLVIEKSEAFWETIQPVAEPLAFLFALGFALYAGAVH